MTQRTEIKKMFGSFWNDVWKEEDFYDALVTSMELMFGRLGRKVDELPKFLSRFDLPTKRYEEADYILVDELTLTRKYVTLGEFNMDQGRTLDELKESPQVWAMPTPLESISVITDSPINPELIWYRGSEFEIVNGELLIYDDPFQEAFRQHLKTGDGESIKLVDLWLLDGSDDTGYLQDHYGRVIGMLTPSSEYYKKIMNAIYDLLQEGATKYRVNAFLGAIADTDVANASGTVDYVWDEGDRTWVAIGDVLHSCPGTGRAIVAQGDVVSEGQLLFDVFKVIGDKDYVDPADFPQLVLGPAFIETASGNILSFENAELETETYQFQIGGAQDDVDDFWANAEAEATERGIDLQEAIIGDQKRPWKINPFEFIRDNFLHQATLFITMDVTAVPDQNALKLLRYLEETLPAGTTFFMNVFGTATEDTVPLCSNDELPGFYANDASEVDIITLVEYIKGSEKLY